MILRLSKLAARLAPTATALLYPALASAQTGDTAVSGALDRAFVVAYDEAETVADKCD